MSNQIQSFDWFVDREKGRPCLVVGTAPTAEDFPYKDFEGIYITMGDGPIRLREYFEADYWVNANHVFPFPEKHIGIINSFTNTVFIFADSVTYSYDSINIDYLKNNIKVKWFAYDQRHFNHKPCKNKLKCCDLVNIYPERIAIQEYIQKKFKTQDCYSTASTVAIHALAFAIIMGCNPIYLQGIEIPLYVNDYKYKNHKRADYLLDQVNVSLSIKDIIFSKVLSLMKLKTWIKILGMFAKKMRLIQERSVFYEDIPQILSDFTYLINLAKNNGIQVFILSKTSTLNKINDMEYIDPSDIIR